MKGFQEKCGGRITMLQFLSVYGGSILASIVSAIILSLMKKYISNQKK